MKTRVLTAIVMVAVMVPFFVFSDTVAFPLLIALLGAIGVGEMFACVGAKKRYVAMLLPLAAALGMPFFARYVGGQDLFTYLFSIAFLLLAYAFAVSVFSGEAYPAEVAAMTGATSVYITFGLTAVLLLRDLPFGEYIYFLAFIIPWMTDTFAYFCGRAFGKHKLIPNVSPKKTVEGSIGGTISAVLLTLLYGFIIGAVTEAVPQYAALGVTALVVSLLSQCGDLIMSLIKRKYGIKDYGKLFPGHGGVLDRFDSILITAPTIYFLTTLVPSMALFV